MFRTNIVKLTIFVFICILSGPIYAEPTYYSFPAINAKGSWETGTIKNEKVILTNKANLSEYIDIEVPYDGYYQLYINLYHTWRKYCPFVYVEIVDSKGKRYSDYAFSERRWYLEEGSGRWEFRSPSSSPFWYLHKGKLKMKFWLESKKSCWEPEEVAMEGELAISKFVLIPIDINKKLQFHLPSN